MVGRLTGFFMPHGLHIRESMDAPGSLLLGCSNYGDSSYALMVLPSSFLESCRRAWYRRGLHVCDLHDAIICNV